MIVSGPVGNPESSWVHKRSPKTINPRPNHKFLGLSICRPLSRCNVSDIWWKTQPGNFFHKNIAMDRRALSTWVWLLIKDSWPTLGLTCFWMVPVDTIHIVKQYKHWPSFHTGPQADVGFFFVTSILTMPNIPYDPSETFEMCHNFFSWEFLEKIYFSCFLRA